MADQRQVNDLKQGVAGWNQRRFENPAVILDLREAELNGANLSELNLSGALLEGAQLQRTDLRGANLNRANLSGANLSEAHLEEAQLQRTDLRGADLNGAKLWKADLFEADLRGANLSGACLFETNLMGANFSGADLGRATLNRAILSHANLHQTDLSGASLAGAFLYQTNLSAATLSGADLEHAQLVDTDFCNAMLIDCRIFAVSAWKLKLNGAVQRNLIITDYDEPAITVDNLEVAQFIYLLLNSQRIRDVIDTITSKAVLILGRFTEERKAVLDAIREELRGRDYVPIMFDFDKPARKDLTGTVETLARMARFIIADLTDPSSIPHELATIVPFLRTTPVLPIRLAGSGGYSMFADYQLAYPWVLKTHEYKDNKSLISDLPKVIAPAEAKAKELQR
jgi:uncharacterized protein YjbI with pentapeptide repeats